MFSDLYDSISLLFSWSWPKTKAVITAVGARGVGEGYRLVVEYKFSIGDEGPYTGESECLGFNESLRTGEPITIRYRRNNPSVNKVDSSVWEDSDSL